MKKLRITEKQAIKECKELWAKVEETGMNKWDVIKNYYPHISKYSHGCPLCEYVTNFTRFATDGCGVYCPLYTKYKAGCYDLGYSDIDEGSYSAKWFQVIRGLK